MSSRFRWSSTDLVQLMQRDFTKYIKMTFKPRNQNNIIPFAKGVKNKLAEEAEERYKKLILSIDNKMQQNFWDALVFDDKELELLANFGETIKFPHETTAVRALSILSTYILKKHAEENSYE